MMFDDDDDDFERSEFEIWYDNNFHFFRRKSEGWHYDEPSLEAEAFYSHVYLSVMRDIKAPLRKLLHSHYPRTAVECRPELVERIEMHINYVGHRFLMYLFNIAQCGREGTDLRTVYPKLDEWAVSYPSYRRPHYLDDSFFDDFTWLTSEQKQQMIAESRKEAEETFVIQDKPCFEFIDMLQQIVINYYPAITDMNRDELTIYQVALYNEYYEYKLDFDHYEGFIDYGFEVEDLKLSVSEYMDKFQIKYRERYEDEMRNRDENTPDEQP